MVTGTDHITASDSRDIYKQYWYYQYPVQGAIALQEMLETAMTPETFQKVKSQHCCCIIKRQHSPGQRG